MGVFARGSKLWIRFRDVDGEWRNVRSGFDVGQESLAQARFDALEKRVAATLVAGDGCALLVDSGTMNVRWYATRWLDERRALGHDWTHDRSRLEHVMPVLGELAIADVRARHLVDAFQRIRTTPLDATGEPPAPRTVRRIYEVLSVMFGDAKLAGLIEQTPCELDERHLGAIADKDPEWRAGALFTRDEATTLISTPIIPDDRKLLYAFMLLAGMRPGEASALRWRHYDRAVEPLGRLTVALAYDSRRNREKSTKTEATRFVPVHPTLAAMLAEWKLQGWESMMGREPEPDDLILPLPPAAAAARRTRDGEPFRSEPYNGKRWREADEPELAKRVPGWRYRELYAMKATFITLVLDDGADPHVIESRVTHTKKSRSAFDGYNRGRQWELTCAEVAKLRLVRRDADELAEPIAVGAGQLVTDLVTAAATRRDDSSSGLRRRVSKAHRPSLYVVPRSESLAVDTGDHTPSDSASREPVTAAVTAETPGDPVAEQLETAVARWRERRDRAALRRALFQALASLEE